MKSVFSEHHYEILFCDFTTVWSEHLEDCDIKQCLKVCIVVYINLAAALHSFCN